MEDKIRVLVSEEEVDRRIAQLGKEISVHDKQKFPLEQKTTR